EAEYTNGEINNQLAVVVRRYRLAVEGGKLISRPAIKKLETNNARQGFFEREQFEAIRSYLAPPLQALVTFGYLTGWRIRSEVQTLEWRHVDFAAGMVRLEVGTTKNKAGRLFPFNVLQELRELLERQRAITTAHEKAHACVVKSVFHRDGKTHQGFLPAWDTACCKAGLGTKDPGEGKGLTPEPNPPG